MKNGFIPIGRDLQDHWIRKDKDYWIVFCEMAFLARFSDKPETKVVEGIMVTINKYEFIFGRPAWCRRLDISEQRMKTLLKKMVAEGFIKPTQRFNKFTVYSFEYGSAINQHINQHTNQQDSEIQPAETVDAQGFEVDANHQKNSNQPTDQPTDQPKKEEGLKEQGTKEECLIPLVGEEKGLRVYTKSFNQFWSLYENKKGKAKASVYWNREVEPALKKGDITMDDILAGTKKYMEYCTQSGRTMKSGDTAISHEVWQDDWEWKGETYGDKRNQQISLPKGGGYKNKTQQTHSDVDDLNQLLLDEVNQDGTNNEGANRRIIIDDQNRLPEFR